MFIYVEVHVSSSILFNFLFGTKLASLFSLKDRTSNNHVYKINCSLSTCNDVYISETARRLRERNEEDAARDKNFHVYKHFTGALLNSFKNLPKIKK